jgi:hypothetical protein
MTVATRLTRRDPRALIDEIGRLDPIAAVVSTRVQRATRSRFVKNALSGTWLGHQLHPLLTDVTIGAWLSASAIDLSSARGMGATAPGG